MKLGNNLYHFKGTFSRKEMAKNIESVENPMFKLKISSFISTDLKFSFINGKQNEEINIKGKYKVKLDNEKEMNDEFTTNSELIIFVENFTQCEFNIECTPNIISYGKCKAKDIEMNKTSFKDLKLQENPLNDRFSIEINSLNEKTATIGYFELMKYDDYKFAISYIISDKFIFRFRATNSNEKSSSDKKDFSFNINISGFENNFKDITFTTKSHRSNTFFYLDIDIKELEQKILAEGVKIDFFNITMINDKTNNIFSNGIKNKVKEGKEAQNAQNLIIRNRSRAQPKTEYINKTPYVGLLNQGATCYMNSALQSLYHLAAFRKLVYRFPTTEEDSTSVVFSLQKLFAQLQLSKSPVSTKELTKSFGWSINDVLIQQDIEEFLHVLIDNLETKMKAHNLDKELKDIFVGKTKVEIKGIDKDFKNQKIEEFYDLPISIQGFPSLEEALDKYTAVELLTGDNKYTTDEFGKQDATMKLSFETLPNVLQIQLRRSIYDPKTMRMVKIKDIFTFPEVLNFRKYLSEDSQEKEDVYRLMGVLVHSGATSSSGHYYTYIDPHCDDNWYKFNDSTVTKSNKSSAIDDNFGGYSKAYSAYMLIYVKFNKIKEFLEVVNDNDIPECVKNNLNTKIVFNEEPKKVYKKDASVVTEDMLRESEFSSLPKKGLKTVQINSRSTGKEVYKDVAEQMNLPEDGIRIFMYSFGIPSKFIKPDNEYITFSDKIAFLVLKIKEGEKVEFSRSRNMVIVKKLNPETNKIEFHSIQYPPKEAFVGALVPYVYSFADMYNTNIKALQISENTEKMFNFMEGKIFEKQGCIIVFNDTDSFVIPDDEENKFLNIFYKNKIKNLNSYASIKRKIIKAEFVDIENLENVTEVYTTEKVIFEELRSQIAAVMNIEYNKNVNAIEIFHPNGVDSYNPKPDTKQELMGYNFIKYQQEFNLKVPRVYFRVRQDVSQVSLDGLLQQRVVFYNDETNEENVVDLLVSPNIKCNELIKIVTKKGFIPTKGASVARVTPRDIRSDYRILREAENVFDYYKNPATIIVIWNRPDVNEDEGTLALFEVGKSEGRDKFTPTKMPRFVFVNKDWTTSDFRKEMSEIGYDLTKGEIQVPTETITKKPTVKSILFNLFSRYEKSIRLVYKERSSISAQASRSQSLKIYN